MAAMAIARPDNSLMLCKSVNMAAIVLKGHRPTNKDPGAPFLAHTYCTKHSPGRLRVLCIGIHDSSVYSTLCRHLVVRESACGHLTRSRVLLTIKDCSLVSKMPLP